MGEAANLRALKNLAPGDLGMGACHLKELRWIWQAHCQLILYNLTYTILAQTLPSISIICCPGSEGDDI